MSTWTAADHPRGDRGRFEAKTRTEPEGELEADRWASTPITQPYGTIEWRTPSGKLHRLDGPAVTRSDGYEAWWQNDERHRIDGPAVIRPDGFEGWYLHGKRHRIGGPAIALRDGTCEWREHDKQHRIDGPAVTWADGYEEWWQDGERHRIDGPDRKSVV